MTLIGTSIGHIRVIRTLGQGGMGNVYVGYDETLQRSVALKAIRAKYRPSAEARARFLREARSLSLLDHPHICRIYDYIEGEEADYLVLELIEGRSLSRAVQEGLDGPRQGLDLAIQIAGALEAAHEKGLVHRDLKPDNVMLTAEGQAKLLDFGLARALGAGDLPDLGTGPVSAVGRVGEPDGADGRTLLDPDVGTGEHEETLPLDPETGDGEDATDSGPVERSRADLETRLGAVVGSPVFMSPEQARGDPATTASDMYSFGLLLQVLFTGRSPQADTSDLQMVLYRAARAETLPVAGIDSDLAGLIGRLKSLAPSARPTAVEARARLRWIRDKPRRRLRRVVIAAILVLVALGALKYTLDLRRERTAAIAARDEADRRRGQAEDLIGFMLGDLRDKLASVGRLEILNEVGDQALAYFEAVPVGELSDEELSRRSQALRQIGEVRMAEGDLAASRDALDESLDFARALRERRGRDTASDAELLRSAEALHRIGQVWLAEGDLASAAGVFAEALATAEELTTLDPDDGDGQKLLGASHFWVGYVDWLRGELDPALERFRSYLAVAERLVARDPEDTEWRLEMAYAHSNIGSVLQARGNLEGALAAFQSTLAIKRRLVEQDPRNADWLLDLAVTHNTIGSVHQARGALEPALEHYRADLAIKRDLVARDPANTTWQNHLATSHNFVGRALAGGGDHGAAREQFRAQLEIMRALVAKDPANALWQRNLATSEKRMGLTLLGRGDEFRATAHLRRARQGLAELVARDSTNADWRRELGSAHEALALGLEAAGDPAAALEEASLGIEQLARIVESRPGDREARLWLARCYLVQGRSRTGSAPTEEARAAWVGALATLEAADAADDGPAWLEARAEALLRLRRIDEARPLIDRLRRAGPLHPSLEQLADGAGAG